VELSLLLIEPKDAGLPDGIEEVFYLTRTTSGGGGGEKERAGMEGGLSTNIGFKREAFPDWKAGYRGRRDLEHAGHKWGGRAVGGIPTATA